ncbi:MAG TPA: cytochrome P450 [Rubrivivax sp.]|nr:cytochrome P450 [Rubrivivax sp.]
MTTPEDWDPRSQPVLDDQIAAYDAMRRGCPVAYSEYLHWSLFRHADVLRVLNDPSTFSSVVSGHVSVPNGMDPPQHTLYRRIIEPYFDAPRMAAFAPECRRIAAELAARLPAGGPCELMADFADEFALRIQCAFLGWPDALRAPLRAWIRDNHKARLAHDRAALAAVAKAFDRHVREQLDARRAAGAEAPDDVTTQLMRERVPAAGGERVLDDEELTSILRNWTVGELGTIAACVGIVAQYLAEREALQQRLHADSALLPAAIDEILRIHAPLIANRRVALHAAEFDGRRIEVGERISLIWAAANRDEAVFGDPDEFRLDRDPALNLLYGAGIHVCPGAPLARLELQLVFEELLRARRLRPQPGRAPLRAAYPGSGYSQLPLLLEARAG